MTGISYDDHMLLHQTDSHPESPQRLISIIEAIKKNNLLEKLIFFKGRKCTRDELLIAHSDRYIDTLETAYRSGNWMSMNKLYGGDCYFNQNTLNAAKMAVGSTINLADRIMEGTIHNGFSIVRPPGHHANRDSPSGFCIFNNVAITALHCRNRGNRVLIVDWDIHHGDGTESIIRGEKNIMLFSVQRYDNGKYYPQTGGTKAQQNIIDIGLNQTGTDKIYYELFIDMLSQMTKFAPDIIIVSSGFDAVNGDPLGGYNLSPSCYGYLTKLLINVCPKILLVLEGGYNCEQISLCSVECLRTLINN
jgi:acetoin utilization deacetylase AcuC-like enzyme